MAATKPAAPELSWRQALDWRMRRHRLLERARPQDLVRVAAGICGVHAQVSSSAELTLWARIEGLERSEVREALWERRSLVKLWAMRGTLHLLPASELGLWLAGLGTYDHYLKPGWLRGFGLTRDELEELIGAIGRALDGRLLTREELGEEVAGMIGSPAAAERIRGSWGPYLKPASFRGMLCFGPSTGQKVTFTTPGSWLPGGVAQVEPGAAVEAIVRRYLGAYAPAAREDLARWWAVSPAGAGRMLAALGDEATEVTVDGEPRWMLRADAREAAGVEHVDVARLLPGFDQWVVGASRSAPALLDARHKPRIHRPQGWISPVLLLNGRMDGVWRHERKGGRLLVEIEPFGRLPGWARRQADAEAQRLAAFLGGELELAWV